MHNNFSILKLEDNTLNILEKQQTTLYEMFILTKGSGLIETDSKAYDLQENSVCFFIPGQERHCHLHESAQGYHLSFSRKFLQYSASEIYFLTRFSNNSELLILTDKELAKETNKILRTMMKEMFNSFVLQKEVLSGLLNVLLLNLLRNLPECMQAILYSREKHLVKQFIALVENRCIDMKQVSDYADTLCITPSHLNAVIKKITGHTASHHIQQQLIQEAKKNALSQNGSMKNTAYELGFKDIAHFSKFFKKNSGMNFTSFKKSLL
jgi:YesN/AraC family two-component response regulator